MAAAGASSALVRTSEMGVDLAIKAYHLIDDTEGLIRFLTTPLKGKVTSPLCRDVTIQKTDPSGRVVVGLKINFFENRLVTILDGKENAVSFSAALKIIYELSDIFAQFKDSEPSEKLLEFQGNLARTLDRTNPYAADQSLTIKGKTAITIHYSIQRVVLAEKSSVPLEMIRNCSFFFNQTFIKEICSVFGVRSNARNLFEIIHRIYLGRCVLGLKSSRANKTCSDQRFNRELGRIISLMQQPMSAFYTNPIE